MGLPAANVPRIMHARIRVTKEAHPRFRLLEKSRRDSWFEKRDRLADLHRFNDRSDGEFARAAIELLISGERERIDAEHEAQSIADGLEVLIEAALNISYRTKDQSVIPGKIAVQIQYGEVMEMEELEVANLEGVSEPDARAAHFTAIVTLPKHVRCEVPDYRENSDLLNRLLHVVASNILMHAVEDAKLEIDLGAHILPRATEDAPLQVSIGGRLTQSQ